MYRKVSAAMQTEIIRHFRVVKRQAVECSIVMDMQERSPRYKVSVALLPAPDLHEAIECLSPVARVCAAVMRHHGYRNKPFFCELRAEKRGRRAGRPFKRKVFTSTSLTL
jgi:hypothetical protein